MFVQSLEDGRWGRGRQSSETAKNFSLLVPFLIPSLGLAGLPANIFKSSLLQAAVKQQLLTELTKHCAEVATAFSLLREKPSLPWPHTTSIQFGRKIISVTQGGAGGTGEGDDEKSNH